MLRWSGAFLCVCKKGSPPRFTDTEDSFSRLLHFLSLIPNPKICSNGIPRLWRSTCNRLHCPYPWHTPISLGKRVHGSWVSFKQYRKTCPAEYLQRTSFFCIRYPNGPRSSRSPVYAPEQFSQCFRSTSLGGAGLALLFSVHLPTGDMDSVRIFY